MIINKNIRKPSSFFIFIYFFSSSFFLSLLAFAALPCGPCLLYFPFFLFSTPQSSYQLKDMILTQQLYKCCAGFKRHGWIPLHESHVRPTPRLLSLAQQLQQETFLTK